jgi:preprotein translocase SecE subunit
MADQVQEDTNANVEPRLNRAPVTPAAPPAPARERGGGPSLFRVLKQGQGIHVRWGTAIGAGALAVALAEFVWDRMQIFAFAESNFFIRAGIPVVVLVAAAWFVFWLVGRSPTTVDFMIATEGEMKKVNWSTRKEVWGATKVVIITVLSLAIMLFVVDMFFIFFFAGIGVLKFDVMRQLFGVGQGPV